MLNYSLTLFKTDKNGRSRELLAEPVTAESDIEAILQAKDRLQEAARKVDEPRPLACVLLDENGDVVWRTPTRAGVSGTPPTVADLKAMGVSGATVACSRCKHAVLLSFDELGVPGNTAFPLLARMNLKCQQCGAPDPVVTPDGGQG